MAVINGTVYSVWNSTERLWSCKNASLKVDVDLPDVTTKEDAGWAKHIQGLRNWSIDFDGVYEDAGGTSVLMTPAEILASIIARTASAEVSFKPVTGTATTGWKGDATFKSITITGNMESGITFSGTIVGNDALEVIAIA
jgi:predicted secreted protein